MVFDGQWFPVVSPCLGAVLCGAGGAVVERTLLNVVVSCLVLSNFH